LPDLSFDTIDVAVNSAGRALDTITLRRNKKDTYVNNLLVSDNLTGNKIRPGSELILKLTSPIKSYQESQITLYEDSTLIRGYKITKIPNSLRTYSLTHPWKTKKQYTLKLADNAFTDILGTRSKPYIKKFEQDVEDNYGSISISISVPDTAKSYLVQWLNERKEIIRQNSIKKNTVLNYIRYPTAKYSIRIIYDINNNGDWDTGNLKEKRQPEKSWNFEKTIALRPNWDLEEIITIPNP
jgi:hypothetical protein